MAAVLIIKNLLHVINLRIEIYFSIYHCDIFVSLKITMAPVLNQLQEMANIHSGIHNIDMAGNNN